MRVLKHEDDGVASEEELGDIAFFLHGVGLFAMRSAREFRPHFEDVFENHVHVSVKSADSGKDFTVVAQCDEHLRVGLDCFEEQREWTLRERVFWCQFLFFFHF